MIRAPFRCVLLPSIALLAVLASGCTREGEGRYPSLLPRAIESRSDAEPEAVAVAATPDPALDAKIATETARIATIRKAVAPVAERAEATARAARGASAGSERWITAQTALAELDDYRAQALAVLADLEQLGLARSAELQADYPALVSAHTAAQTEVDSQTARIARLQASLAGG